MSILSNARLTQLTLALLSISAIFPALIAASAAALSVRIAPEDPQLGDTLSVVAVPDPGETAPPTVTVGDRAYPMFEVDGL